MNVTAKQQAHEMLFAPCFEGEHSDCIGYSNSLRRDGELTICNCECHQDDAQTEVQK